jgi:hypothetical protein
MTKSINTYEELLNEEQLLLLKLQTEREIIKEDIRDIKEKFEPLSSVLSLVQKAVSRDTGNWLMNTTVNKAIDVVVKKLILGRAGWLTKLVVPFFLKNYSSHFIASHKDEIMDKLGGWVKNIFSSNGKMKEEKEDAGPVN